MSRSSKRFKGSAAWKMPLRMIWLGMKCALLVTLLVLLYLGIAGFPQSGVRWIEQRLAAAGYDARIGQIYWHPAEGVIASSIQLYLLADDRVPAVELDELILRFDPRHWLRGESGLQQVKIRNAHLHASLLRPLLDREDPNLIRAEIRRAVVGVQPRRWVLQETQMRVLGMDLTAAGQLEIPVVAPAAPPVGEWRSAWQAWQETPPEWLQTLVHDVGTLQMLGESVAAIDFEWVVGFPERNHVEARWSAQDVVFRGLRFEDLLLHIRYADQMGSIPVLQLSAAGGRLSARGQWLREADRAELYLYSNLLPVYWRNLLPDGLRRPMEQARVHVFGETEVEVTVGPSPLREFGNIIRARVRAQEVDAHGVWMEAVETYGVRNHNLIHLFDLQARLGRGEGQGTAQGQVTYDLGEDLYYGEVVASLDPQIVLPIAGYSRIASEIIQGIQIGDAVPELDVHFSGNVRDRPTFNFEGVIRGNDFVYAGSRVVSFDSTFRVTNRVMRIDPLEVHRREGSVTGWYQQDFDADRIDLDVVSSVDPRVLGRLAGGAVEEILRLFRFEGPVEVAVEGRIDYRQHEQTDYRAHGRAEQVGWRLLLADECTLEWIAKGDQISLTNMVAKMYGGDLMGHIDLNRVGGEEPVVYAAQGELRNLAFAELLRDLRQAESEMQRGALSGRFKVTGLAEDDWRASVNGQGRVRIRDGQIFQIRLFGGLSDLLQRIYPRLGMAVQSDVEADFTIEDRRVASSDIRFIGNIISLRGWGDYSLDDELDFTVQVQPLRRGFLVDAVRFVTYPVSRLLQYRLDGTLSEPRWRMDPLPRERVRSP